MVNCLSRRTEQSFVGHKKRRPQGVAFSGRFDWVAGLARPGIAELHEEGPSGFGQILVLVVGKPAVGVADIGTGEPVVYGWVGGPNVYTGDLRRRILDGDGCAARRTCIGTIVRCDLTGNDVSLIESGGECRACSEYDGALLPDVGAGFHIAVGIGVSDGRTGESVADGRIRGSDVDTGDRRCSIFDGDGCATR